MRWSTKVQGDDIPMEASAGSSQRVLMLAHGAGSSMDHKTVVWLSSLTESLGLQVVRFNFLYRVRGKSMPDRMPTLMETYRAAAESVRSKLTPKALLLGGHSMGGRVASHVLADVPDFADGLVLFGYPLHPAGNPEKLRAEHLSKISAPTLQVNGTRDALCTRELMEEVRRKLDARIWSLHWIEGADHSYAVPASSGRSRRDVGQEITETVRDWFRHFPSSTT